MQLFYKIGFFFLISFRLLSSAITYEFSGGRFGDNLLAYCHAKWASYVTGLPLLYKPFPYSDQLMLSLLETIPASPYYQELYISGNIDPYLLDAEDTLFRITYFAELSWGGPCVEKPPFFNVNWDDPDFRTLLRTALVPRKPVLCTATLPEDRISVAVHFRNGGKFEPDLHERWACKAPRISFFLEHVRYLYEFLEKQPLFVYIFTDHDSPQEVVALFQKTLKDCDIVFSAADKAPGWNSNVLEDFFTLTKFACAIHGDSNFSNCAGFLADYDIEIRPIASKWVKEQEYISRIVMRTHFDKSMKPEYRIIGPL